jgi:tRNA (guanosine-2'-O-)-methyltransferase
MSVLAHRQLRVRAALHRRLASVIPVLEAVNRRHNSSAILRSAECFGCHEVHMVTGRFKPAKGAARGSERWLELHRHQRLTDCAEALKRRGFSIYVADLSVDAMDPEQVPVDSPLAIVFGSELEGVSDEARSLADGLVTVPMQGLTESLNVSVAAACILQRLTARRRVFLGGGDLELQRQESFYEDWLVREDRAQIGMAARAELHR